MIPAGTHCQAWLSNTRHVPGVVEHVAPGRRGRLDAEAEVAEAGLEEHDGRDAEARVDEQRRDRVREDVRDDDRPVADADDPGGDDVVRLAQLQELRRARSGTGPSR